MPSELYNKNIYATERSTVAEVQYSLVAPQAKELASVKLPESGKFSRPDQIINNITNISARIATFEPNYWKLDGSFALPLEPQNSNMEVGFWNSVMSNNNGEFETPPVIEITFSEVQDIKRFGIAFDEPSDNFCTDFQVTVYNSSMDVILDERINNNSAYGHTKGSALKAYKVVYTFYRTNFPNRFLRVSEFDFGILIKFDNSDIFSLSLTTETDPTGGSFPLSRLNLSIANNERFDQLDPESYLQFLYQRQPFEYRHGLVLPNGATEWIYKGAYYLSDWNVSDTEVNFTCNGKAGTIESFTYYDSTFEEFSVGELIKNVLDKLRMGYYIPPMLFNSPSISGFFGNVNYRKILALLAELSCCVAFENEQNTIEFLDILQQQDSTDLLNYDNMFDNPKIELQQYYNGINLKEKTISLEESQIINTTMEVSGSSDITIYYSSPVQGIPTYTITSGFTLTNIKHRTMYMTATLNGNGNAEIIVKGYRVNFADSEIFYPAPWHDPLEADFPYSVDLPMMIKTSNYKTFRAWFLSRKFGLLRKRLSTEVEWRQNPAQGIGDTVSVQLNKSGRTTNMIAVRHTINFNGGALSGSTKTVGDSLT